MGLSVDIEKRIGSFRLRVRFETEGGVLGLLGASGCGKSMTLRCIAGIERPDRGRIVLNGRVLFDSKAHVDLPPQARRTGYLFQNYALFPNLTVRQNVEAALHRLPRRERSGACDDLLRRMRLDALAHRRPETLSGGEQQRTALARILASAPDVLLLDEPFSALDEHLKWQVELELMQALQGFSGEVIFVSHSRVEISRLCQAVCVLDEGCSAPVQTVEELLRAPGTIGAARVSGCENLSPLERRGAHLAFCPAWGASLRTAADLPADADWVGVRAHGLRPVDGMGENVLPCRPERVIDDVFREIWMLRPDGGTELLRMELPKGSISHPGNRVWVQIPPEEVMPLRNHREW